MNYVRIMGDAERDTDGNFIITVIIIIPNTTTHVCCEHPLFLYSMYVMRSHEPVVCTVFFHFRTSPSLLEKNGRI